MYVRGSILEKNKLKNSIVELKFSFKRDLFILRLSNLDILIGLNDSDIHM